jgi:hypothetical protein
VTVMSSSDDSQASLVHCLTLFANAICMRTLEGQACQGFTVCTYGQCVHHLWEGGRLSTRPLDWFQELCYDPRLVVVQLLRAPSIFSSAQCCFATEPCVQQMV